MNLVRLNNKEFLPGKRAYHGMDDMFNWFMNEAPGYGGCNNYPSANIIESDDDFKIEMLVPGLKKKDIRLQIENGILNISHEILTDEQEVQEKYITREFQTREFSRKFKLSDRLASDKIKAKYENGVLTIKVPKKEEAKAKPLQEITIA